MTKHTPGPWRVGDYERGSYSITAECRSPIPILRTVGNGLPQEIDKANATLCAAAPDMLQALLDVVDLAEYAGRAESWKANTYGLVLGTLPKIRAAIKKAEGGAV